MCNFRMNFRKAVIKNLLSRLNAELKWSRHGLILKNTVTSSDTFKLNENGCLNGVYLQST